MVVFKKIPFYIVCLLVVNSYSINIVPYPSRASTFFVKDSSFVSSTLIQDNTRISEIRKIIKEDDFRGGVALLLEYIEEQETLKNNSEIIKAYSVMAEILMKNGDYQQSLSYYYKMDKYIQNDAILLSSSCFCKGGNYQFLSELDSSMYYYKSALKYIVNLPNLQKEKAKINSNLSGIYYLKKEYVKALKVAKLADSIQENIGDSVIRAGILNSIGAIYYMQGSYQKSLETYKKVLELSEEKNTTPYRNTRSLSYINLAYAYSGLGDFEQAFHHQDMYFTLNDSLQSELKYKEINDIQAKYALVKKNAEIKDANLKIKKARFMSYGLGFMLLFLGLGVWFLIKYYKLNRKNMRLEFSQQQLLNENKFKELEKSMHIRSLNAALDGRLEERKKIASILHDNVSTLLSSANLHLHASRMLLKCEVPEEITKTQEIIKEAGVKIRDLSHTLISSVLLKFGLGYAVRDLCEKSSNSQLDISCCYDGIKRYDQNFEIKLHNIINELLNNILKHSNASAASVLIEDKESKIYIVVKDNGKGFDVERVMEKNGLGLSHANSRILAMGGMFVVNSEKGKGTEIFISAPFLS